MTKTEQIDNVPANSVLFLSCPPAIGPNQHTNAIYGGLMSTRAQNLHAAGAIINGSIRDLQEHRSLRFPVWARDVGVASPSPVWKVGGVNVPIAFPASSTSPIKAGDYLMGDVNGVVHLPLVLAEKALALIPSQAQADELVTEDLLKGRPFVEASKEHRKSVRRVEEV